MRNPDNYFSQSIKRRRFENHSPTGNMPLGNGNDAGSNWNGGSDAVMSDAGNGGRGNEANSGGSGVRQGEVSGTQGMYLNNNQFPNGPANFQFTAPLPPMSLDFNNNPASVPQSYNPGVYMDCGSPSRNGRTDRQHYGPDGAPGAMNCDGDGGQANLASSAGAGNMPMYNQHNRNVPSGSMTLPQLSGHQGPSVTSSQPPAHGGFGNFGGPRLPSPSANPPTLPPLPLPLSSQMPDSLQYAMSPSALPPNHMDPLLSPPVPMHPHSAPSSSDDRGNVFANRRHYRPRHSQPLPSAERSNSNVANLTTGTSDGSLAIRNILPVKEALGLLRDACPIILALAQTILQTGPVRRSPSEQRSLILNFKGFGRNDHVDTRFLTMLSKSDLDILAWIFVVSKHGKKEEVANRIVSSLRVPITYRVPVSDKRPHIPNRIDSRISANAVSNSSAGISNNSASHQSAPSSRGRGRGGMSLSMRSPHTNGTSSPSSNVMDNLSRQLNPDTFGATSELVALTSSTTQTRTPTTTPIVRSKQTHLQCHHLLQGYDFKDGENPFNDPLNAPLGNDKFVVFTSTQLSRGTDDPILKFSTPAPITTRDDPKVAGGDVQIHLRCLRVEMEKPRTEWKQSWPFPALCRVNGHVVSLNQAQRYTNGKLAGRDAATNISGFLRKYSADPTRSMNKVLLRRQSSSASPAWGQYVMFAQEILVYSHETMIKSVEETSGKYWQNYRKTLEEKGELTPESSDFEMARVGVKQFLNDPDGLQMSSMKVSLRCPLALVRISIPVKGRRCHHVQCFDLSSFLEYSRRSSKFECPVCNKPTADPKMLIKSPFIEHALREFADCDDVAILTDGNIEAVAREQTGVASEDEDGEADGQNSAATPAKPAAGTLNEQVSKSCEVVDLTLDSDDDVGVSNEPEADQENEENEANAGQPENETSAIDHQGSFDQDSDIDFTFHSDTFQWGPQTDLSTGNFRNGSSSQHELPSSTQAPNNERPNWGACDVIALDSD